MNPFNGNFVQIPQNIKRCDIFLLLLKKIQIHRQICASLKRSAPKTFRAIVDIALARFPFD